MIGVILMVAITVILAAVIAAFVLGFGADADSAPAASWSADDVVDGDGTITFTHEGGSSVDGRDLVLRGAGLDDVPPEDEDEVRSGQSVSFIVGSGTLTTGDEVRLVWDTGDDSAVLYRHTVSDSGWSA